MFLMKHSKKILKMKLALLILSIISTALASFCMFYLEPEGGILGDIKSSRVVMDRDGVILSVYLSPDDEWCIPVSLDKMGKWAPDIAVAIEDKRFYSHSGVDLLAICRAAVQNIASRKVVSGASTITAQLVRMSIPRQRTIKNKAIEFWSAVRLESRMTKKEILELYLNRAPFGGNIRGIEAASRAYFNKPSNLLTLGETTLLISLLRSPSLLRPDRYPLRAQRVKDAKLSYLFKKNIISRENMNLALDEQVSARRYAMPRRASMASSHVLRNSDGASLVRSSICLKYQDLLELNLKSALSRLPDSITASGVIIENKSGCVLAYTGNARDGSNSPAAQVDCGDAPRSPGSALKPFIYSEAFENGLLTPSSLLADTPVTFNGTAPRNFDTQYRGPMSARNALSLSLNAPAVRVLRMVGYAQTLSALKELGFSHIDKDSVYYSDSLALGGCDVTLLELANAYRTLAAGGNLSPLRWTEGTPQSYKRIFLPETAWMTSDILFDEKRLMPLYQQIFSETEIFIAFKTGTSHGLRDAWSAGYTDRLTIVVWFGIPDGRAHSSLVGLEAAAPVMLKIFRELWREGDSKPRQRPSGIYSRDVCALSGLPPSKACPHIMKDYAISDISPNSLCPIHKNIDGTLVTQWPKELDDWIQMKGRNSRLGEGIRITRPTGNKKIIAEKNKLNTRLFFVAEGPLPHYWYLDGKFIGMDKNGSGLFSDTSIGLHRASVLSMNASDTVEFNVVENSPRNFGNAEKILN
jgi:penicillin-binding protein 1C